MHCPQCGSRVPEGSALCPSCQHVLGTTPLTAVGAMTPPDGLEIHVPSPHVVDELAVRLQAAIGDQYRVEKTLGAGGFAVVYQVRDVNLKRKLAVKVLSPDLITSKTVLERFKREAETVAQLSHPHIVPLHFIGQKDDLLFLAMECIDGGSLADKIEKEGKLTPDDTARFLREVASALAYAHKRGVIHRDIKPHNVLIEEETGRSLVTDFGIARTAEGSSLTASGMLVGTPAYLAPEQVTGAPSDHRADIYALGVMAYEMLTGVPPFSGPTPTAVLMKRLAEAPPPLAKARPDSPQVLRDVIDGCLAQNPEERFQSAMDIVRALGGATPASGPHPTADIVVRNRRKKRKTVWIAAGAIAGAIVAVAVIAGVFATSGPEPVAIRPVDAGMVVIPGGEYVVGAPSGFPIDQPPHQVTLESFGLDTHEVSVGAYSVFVETRRALAPWTRVMPDTSIPVTGVLFAEAGNYCLWKHPDGGSLPTEEQWEAAARGKDGRVFPWGSTFELGRANTLSARRGAAAPVGSFPQGRTPEGVHDMTGNVWEWTSSRWMPYPGSNATVPAGTFYVIRGGAYNTDDANANAYRRGALSPLPTSRAEVAWTGFRCAMPVRQPVAGGR